MSPALRLQLPPEWEAIKACWDGCMAHLAGQGLDPDASYALCMATQELLENAVKYGEFAPGQAIDLDIAVNPRDVTIEVRHPAPHDAGRLKQLDDTIQWIRGYQNPFEAYVEKLKDVSSRPGSPGESGLGLVRVAYEARCLLDFFVDDANALAMSAVYRR